MATKIYQTEDNYHEALDRLYNTATHNGATVTQKNGEIVIMGASELYRNEEGEERIRLDNRDELVPDSNNLLVGCPFNEVLFWDFKGTLGDSSLAFSPQLVKVEFSAHPGTPLILEQRCFQNCTALTGVKFQDGLEEIGDECFSNCPALADDNSREAFPTCTGGELQLPHTVKRIGKNAFYGCYSLRYLVVPKDCVVEDEENGMIQTGSFFGAQGEAVYTYTKVIRR